jgi:YfiH family protein
MRWAAPGPYEVVFTSRVGGVSEGPYASLNLGRKTGDDVARVDENRRIACDGIGADVDRLALNYQVHSTLVHRAQPGARGEHGDGLWTDDPGLPVLAMSADCLPLALARANGGTPAVAVLHTGWRGLLDGIVASGVAALGGGPLAAAIGPAIGPCCYQVRDDVAAPYRARFGDDIVRDGRLDLWRAAEQALHEAGVATVERTDLCTACNPELFFSHRRDGKLRGVQGVLARVA